MRVWFTDVCVELTELFKAETPERKESIKAAQVKVESDRLTNAIKLRGAKWGANRLNLSYFGERNKIRCAILFPADIDDIEEYVENCIKAA